MVVIQSIIIKKNSASEVIKFPTTVRFLILILTLLIFVSCTQTNSNLVFPRTQKLKAWIYDCMPTTTEKFKKDAAINPEKSAFTVCQHYAQVCEQSSGNEAFCSKGFIKNDYENNKFGLYPGINIKQKQYGSTLLIWAVKSGDVDTVEILLKNGADVNEPMGGGWTPLIEAEEKDYQDIIRVLKKYGAK